LAVPAAADRSTYQLAMQLQDPELTPAAAATRQELTQLVEQALGQLGEQDCEIIVMRHYEQLSNTEVAEVLGLSEPAASMRYLRAVRRLRALLLESSRAGQAPATDGDSP
jgi:RNA polymerase sigma-70 factor (ECF subfamily)